jgi:hypothetical protein
MGRSLADALPAHRGATPRDALIGLLVAGEALADNGVAVATGLLARPAPLSDCDVYEAREWRDPDACGRYDGWPQGGAKPAASASRCAASQRRAWASPSRCAAARCAGRSQKRTCSARSSLPRWSAARTIPGSVSP